MRASGDSQAPRSRGGWRHQARPLPKELAALGGREVIFVLHQIIRRRRRAKKDVDGRDKPGHGERRECALHRQSVLPRQLLQRHLRPCADVLDHFGCRQRAEPAAHLMARAADEAEQEAGGE
jgi:hypothetical protein